MRQLIDLNVFLAERSGLSVPEEVKKIINPIFMIILILSSIALIVLIMLQKSSDGSVTALSGSTETYMGKNMSKSPERKAKIATLVLGIVMVIVSIVFFILQVV